MALHELAGKPAPKSMLVNIPRLVAAYYTNHPDGNCDAEKVAFGTSGHRGTSFKNSFNEDHILATTQAICDYRTMLGIDGPLFKPENKAPKAAPRKIILIMKDTIHKPDKAVPIIAQIFPEFILL